tara:strand:- start:556 stop:912 length:357 start_codon:yes stop_codon:yes gene_type:complete
MTNFNIDATDSSLNPVSNRPKMMRKAALLDLLEANRCDTTGMGSWKLGKIQRHADKCATIIDLMNADDKRIWENGGSSQYQTPSMRWLWIRTVQGTPTLQGRVTCKNSVDSTLNRLSN